jgi:GDSL-like lipase/acylhydrolase family protein
MNDSHTQSDENRQDCVPSSDTVTTTVTAPQLRWLHNYLPPVIIASLVVLCIKIRIAPIDVNRFAGLTRYREANRALSFEPGHSMEEIASSNGFRILIEHPPAKILLLNAWLRDECADRHDIYVDYFDSMVDEDGLLKRDLSDDGIHPNAKGYAVMTAIANIAVDQVQ